MLCNRGAAYQTFMRFGHGSSHLAAFGGIVITVDRHLTAAFIIGFHVSMSLAWLCMRDIMGYILLYVYTYIHLHTHTRPQFVIVVYTIDFTILWLTNDH